MIPLPGGPPTPHAGAVARFAVEAADLLLGNGELGLPPVAWADLGAKTAGSVWRALPGVIYLHRALEDDPAIVETCLHEYAHTFQLAKALELSEPGAEAFATRWAGATLAAGQAAAWDHTKVWRDGPASLAVDGERFAEHTPLPTRALASKDFRAPWRPRPTVHWGGPRAA